MKRRRRGLKTIAAFLMLTMIFGSTLGTYAAQLHRWEVQGLEQVFDYPVRVVQKTGPDDERYVILIAADYYNAGNMEGFANITLNNVDQFFSYEPFKTYREYFNIYIVETPSVAGRYGLGSNDSFFQMYIYGDRLLLPTTQGTKNANQLMLDFADKYLDEGGKVRDLNIVVNGSHGGSAILGGETGLCMQGSTQESDVMVHEMAHAIGRLSDEYMDDSYILSKGGPNLDTEPDPTKCKWSEFVGFRGVRHLYYSDGYYKAAYGCMMNQYSPVGFCEVCKLELANAINEDIGENRKDLYIAKPIIMIHPPGGDPMEVKENLLYYGNSYPLIFRTVLKNYEDTPRNVKLHMVVTDSNGNKKAEKEMTAAVAPGAIKSVSVEFETHYQFTDGDKVSARLLDADSGAVLAEWGKYQEQYGTVKVQYRLGDKTLKTDIRPQGLYDREVEVELGTNYTWEATEIPGYEYVGSSTTETTIPVNEEEIVITHYYNYASDEPEVPEQGESVADIFIDVAEDAWYKDSVQYVYDEGIILGNGNLFSPDDATTRAMVATILYRLEGSPKVTDYKKYDQFKDLKAGEWYADAIAWALNEGVATGDDYNMLYNPNEDVTREQLATFLYRYAEYAGEDITVNSTEEELFGGTYVNEWAKEGFAWAIDRGIIKGAEMTDSTGNVYYDLNPQGGAARAQFARMLHRHFGGAVD